MPSTTLYTGISMFVKANPLCYTSITYLQTSSSPRFGMYFCCHHMPSHATFGLLTGTDRLTNGLRWSKMVFVIPMPGKHGRKIKRPKPKPSAPLKSPWYTIPEVARYFRKADRTILRWIHKGKIEARKIGGEWRISREAIERVEQVDSSG